MDFSVDYWLEITVDGNILLPRVKLSSSPYAYRAAIADSVVGGSGSFQQLRVDGEVWLTESVTFAAGTGIDLDQVGETITISAPGGGSSQWTDHAVDPYIYANNNANAQVWDNPDIGESNDTTYRWWFYPQVDGIGENAQPEHTELWVSPNPFNSACRVNAPDGAEIQIYDVNGKLVDRLAPGTRYWTPSEDIGTGVYLLRMKSAQGEYFHKAVYAK